MVEDGIFHWDLFESSIINRRMKSQRRNLLKQGRWMDRCNLPRELYENNIACYSVMDSR